jgi:hypothetical protein
VLVQVLDLGPHRRAEGLRLRHPSERGHDLTAPARAELVAQGPVRRRPFRLRQAKRLQRQADVVRRVVAIQDPLDPLRVQPGTPDDPVQPVPDPGRPVRDERHRLGPRRPQAMEVEGHQLHQVVRPAHRAVDPGPRPLEHPPLAVAEVEDQELGLAPFDADLAAVLNALALGGLDPGADANPPAVGLGDDILSDHLLTRGELTVAPAPQIASPGRQDLGPQLRGHAVDGLLIEGRPLMTEFVAGQLDRGEQGGEAAHPALQGRSGALADAEGGQLGIGPGPLPSPAPGGARLGAAVDGGDPDDQTPQEVEPQPPRLRGASGSVAAVWPPFFPGSPRLPEVVASARRLAVIWSAR